MVSWCNRKQTSVDLSTIEAEYIALCVAFCEAVWLRKLLADLFGHEMDSTVIHCDNQSCGKQYMCNTFLHTSRLQMSSPNCLPGQRLSTFVRDLA
jgi:hypothetical protein